GVALTPWSPLGGGWLTGKYRRDSRPTGATRLGEDPGRGVEAYDARDSDRTWAVLDVVAEIADRHERPMGQVAVAWLLGRPGVASVLLGARTAQQLSETLDVSELELTEAEQDRLTAVSAPGLPPYPYAMLEQACDVQHWRRLGTRVE
ncbi:MAG: aldo/keto reductase, partial [Phycicoccus sp.]